MSAGSFLKLRTDDGLIDAVFSVHADGDSFDIILESRGGSRSASNAKNTEYNVGLEELLRRSQHIATSLVDCRVVSQVTASYSAEEQRVQPLEPYEYPIALTSVADFEDLRKKLTSPQTDIASTAPPGKGNQTKRILLRFIANRPDLSSADIVTALDAEEVTGRKRDRKDIAVGVSSSDIDLALAEWRAMEPKDFHAKYNTRPAAKYVIADPDGVEYDAKAILFCARKFAGLDGENSDFDGDRETVAEPLKALGYIVEDISDPDDEDPEESPAPVIDSSRAIQQAREFAGKTDAVAERKVRREQRLLRRALGLGGGSHQCALCGREFPDRLLVAAHIKKRSACTDEEKIDIPAVAMIACALGCDVLFEHGYVVINDEGIIETTSRVAEGTHLHDVAQMLEGRAVIGPARDSDRYFRWHRKHFLTKK